MHQLYLEQPSRWLFDQECALSLVLFVIVLVNRRYIGRVTASLQLALCFLPAASLQVTNSPRRTWPKSCVLPSIVDPIMPSLPQSAILCMNSASCCPDLECIHIR